MTRFDAIMQCASEYNTLEDLDRPALLVLHEKYRPHDCDDLIDLEYMQRRLESIPLSELRNEVSFYMSMFGY